MLHEKTIEYITGLSDEQLAEYILVGTRVYEPEALAFAQQELDRRQIAPERLTEIRKPLISRVAQYDAHASIDDMPHRASAILCQGCGYEVPNTYVEYRQNIGAFVLRFPQRYKGYLCKRCNQKYFWKATLITLFFGWWGIISFFVTLAFLLDNILTYLKTLSLAPAPRYARRPRNDDEVTTELSPHVASIMQRLEAGEDIEDVARDVSSRTDLTPGQILCFIRDILRQPFTDCVQVGPVPRSF